MLITFYTGLVLIKPLYHLMSSYKHILTLTAYQSDCCHMYASELLCICPLKKENSIKEVLEKERKYVIVKVSHFYWTPPLLL